MHIRSSNTIQIPTISINEQQQKKETKTNIEPSSNNTTLKNELDSCRRSSGVVTIAAAVDVCSAIAAALIGQAGRYSRISTGCISGISESKNAFQVPIAAHVQED